MGGNLMDLEQLSNVQLAGIYDALLALEEDGSHTNKENEHEMVKVMDKLEAEICTRVGAIGKPPGEVEVKLDLFLKESPYSEASGFEYH